MSSLPVDRCWRFLAAVQPVIVLLWLGLAVFTVAVAILMYSRWGQSRPLRKCMALSLLAHLLLAGYATTVQIITPVPMPPTPTFHVSLRDFGPDEDELPKAGGSVAVAKGGDRPWEAFPSGAVAPPAEPKLDRGKTDLHVEPKRWLPAENPRLAGEANLDHLSLVQVKPPESKTVRPSQPSDRRGPAASQASPAVPAAQRRDAAEPDIPSFPIVETSPARPRSAQPVRPTPEDVPTALTQAMPSLPRMTQSEPTAEPKSDYVDLPRPTMSPAGTELVAPRIADRRGRDVFDDDPAPDGNASRTDRSGVPGSGLVGQFASSGTSLTRKGIGGGNRPGGVSLGPNGNGSNSSGGGPGLGGAGSEDEAIPNAYRLRLAPNRADLAKQQGGSVETEAAVKAALKWLADHQSPDGHWDPRAYGAGVDRNVLGHTHGTAGSRADTGLTGLALLAFLASGHTHRDGPYQNQVRRGLEYLLQSQASDGSLGGPGELYEFMYCHAMAACALSEAYGMTRDPRLHDPVARAIAFTVAAQDPTSGGWRYKPGMPGDTSQLGWQLMALKSADLAGIPISEQTRQEIIRFLRSVSSGQHGGRASYRPGEQVTRTMSAEALVCWQFLGLPREDPACSEAGDLLLGELPGEGVYNLYYWYYGTLAMYNLGNRYWEQWNAALRKVLVGRQVQQGPQAGSWEPDDLWGCHGGRIYTTAMATLTLEVYYRFLPLYTGVSTARNPTSNPTPRLR